jgi:membrane protein DedA with SNARE-associated domain
MGETVALISAAIWLAGWLLIVVKSGGLDRGQPHQGSRLLAIALLFVVWPFVALLMWGARRKRSSS